MSNICVTVFLFHAGSETESQQHQLREAHP